MQLAPSGNVASLVMHVPCLPTSLVCGVILITTFGGLGQVPVHAEILECQVAENTPLPDVIVNVAFLVPSVANKDATTIIEESSYVSDANGKYAIAIPDLDLPRLQATIHLQHEKYLARRLGPISVDDLRKYPRSIYRRPSLRKRFIVQGRVLLPTGEPAVAAKVITASKYRAYSWKIISASDYRWQAETRTDNSGSFTLSVDRLSTFRVHAAGFATLLVDTYDASANTNELVLQLPHARRVFGRVTDHAGKPISMAIVAAKRHFTWNESDMPLAFGSSAITDENGRFEFPALAKDVYEFSVASRVSNSADVLRWQQRTMNNVYSTPYLPAHSVHPHEEPIDVIPLTDTFTSKKIELKDEESGIDFSPSDNVRVPLIIKWPDGSPPEGDAFHVQMEGVFQQREWKSRLVAVGENGRVDLWGPAGLENVRINTGLVRFQGADSKTEFGVGVPLAALAANMTQVEISKLKIVPFTVTVKMAAAAAALHRKGEAVDFHAFYARPGYPAGRRTRGRVFVQNARRVGNQQFTATGAVGEEIVLQVFSSQNAKASLIFEERIRLTSDGDNSFEFDATTEKSK